MAGTRKRVRGKGKSLPARRAAGVRKKPQRTALEVLTEWYSTPSRRPPEYWDDLMKEISENRFALRSPEELNPRAGPDVLAAAFARIPESRRSPPHRLKPHH